MRRAHWRSFRGSAGAGVSALAGEIPVDRHGGVLAVAHGQDNGGAAADEVSALGRQVEVSPDAAGMEGSESDQMADVKMQAIAEGSELAFNTGRHHYGVSASRNVFYGYWQYSVRVEMI